LKYFKRLEKSPPSLCGKLDDVRIIRLLLYKEASVTAVDNNGDTTLTCVGNQCSFTTDVSPIIEALITAGADVNAKNNRTGGPL